MWAVGDKNLDWNSIEILFALFSFLSLRVVNNLADATFLKNHNRYPKIFFLKHN